MIIGIPKEIKTQEFRVGLSPDQVKELVGDGHQCIVQRGAATAIGYIDAAYHQAGATLVDTAGEVYQPSELIVKVKEPQPDEYSLLRPGQCVFCFFHLAANPELARALQQSQAICLAYETVTDDAGRLPLLAPMSEVAGRMAVQAGVAHLTNVNGGKGILIGGVTGVPPAKVVIIGGGVVGTQAARVAVGLGGQVVVLDKNPRRLEQLAREFDGQITTLIASTEAIDEQIATADLVVGAVLVSGASAPKVISRAQLKKMQSQTVLVDVAIDQGGCFETSHPTTHEQPTFIVDDIIHYCVANIPGAVAHTATKALTHATFPLVKELAGNGIIDTLKTNTNLRCGLTVCRGSITNKNAADSLGLPYTDPLSTL